MTRLVAALTVLSAVCFAAAEVPIPDPGFGGAGDGIARVPLDIVAGGSDVASAAVVADGKLVLAGMAQVGAPTSAVVATGSVVLDGDYLYMVGSNANTGGGNRDFVATRYVLPLFRDGFDRAHRAHVANTTRLPFHGITSTRERTRTCNTAT